MQNTGESNGTTLQYSCLENPMDGGAWKATVHGVAERQTRLSDFPFTFHFHALDCHSLLQRNLPTQGLNPGLLHHRQILYHLSYREVLFAPQG